MSYVTTKFHNLKARFVFDIRAVTISVWKNPRKWLKLDFYAWWNWQIGPIEFFYHRREKTK